MRKVVHLTSVHSPYDVRILQKEAATLAGGGYEVVLVAPALNDFSECSVSIRAVKPASNRARRFTLTGWRVFRAALRERADLYHFHDPELIPVGLLLRFIGKKVVYDVHEDVPKQILAKDWIGPKWRVPVATMIGLLEGLAGFGMSAVIGATPTITERFPSKTSVCVRNFPRLDDFDPSADADYATRPMSLAYIGGISPGRGGWEMVRAVELLQQDHNARLILAGRVTPDKFEDELRKTGGWRFVDFLGWQDRAGIRRILAHAKIGLVALHPLPNHVESMPIKLFEYMAAGLPVVASAFPLWRSIVERHKCGILVDPTDARAIADAAAWLLSNPIEAREMGERGRAAIVAEYEWNLEAKKLLDLYRSILC